ncbi:MAG: hypothetical protein ACLPWS_20695, partial [Rhodomicrobium sp.]
MIKKPLLKSVAVTVLLFAPLVIWAGVIAFGYEIEKSRYDSRIGAVSATGYHRIHPGSIELLNSRWLDPGARLVLRNFVELEQEEARYTDELKHGVSPQHLAFAIAPAKIKLYLSAMAGDTAGFLNTLVLLSRAGGESELDHTV